MTKKYIKIVPILLISGMLFSACSNGTSNSKPKELPNSYNIFDARVLQYLQGTEIDQFISDKCDKSAKKAFPLNNNGKEYTIKLSTSKDLSNPLVYKTTSNELVLTNFFAYTTYYYSIYDENGAQVEEIKSFSTSYGPRLIDVDGIVNVRDIGAYGADKYIKQGRVYRGSEADGHYAITETGKKVIKDDLKIKFDLDLRTNNESNNATTSALDESITYERISLSAYQNCTMAKQAEMYANCFKVFAKEENYPIYMHCYQGADRTGTIAYLLEALMGVPEDELKIDYELTTFSGTNEETYRDSSSSKDTSHSYHLIKENITSLYKGKNLQASVEKYMLEGLKLDKQTIDSIKANLSAESVGNIATFVEN